MRNKKAWALALGVTAVVLAGFWAAPRVFPGLAWGLDELNQVAGIASAAMAAATLAVSLWPSRPGPASPEAETRGGGGGGANTVTGDVSGNVTQAHTIHGGAGNTTTYGADHIDFSGGTFHGPVTGKHEEHHHRPDTGPEHP
ncbi:hypothetical protein ACFVWN_11590 [Nocardiopsis flavescens]|uniref:hypothetical protein n=1 Tax=Nocardiopsis flavescens TaxID=758803 RepID=UPI00365346FF